MRKPTVRVIFDRSAFHGDRFDLLRNSPLSHAKSAGIPLRLSERVVSLEACVQI